MPEVVIRYVAGQLGMGNWTSVKPYGDRQQTPYEHAWEIRDLLEYREGLLRPGPVPGAALYRDPRPCRAGDGRPGDLRGHRRPAERPYRYPGPAPVSADQAAPAEPGMIPLTIRRSAACSQPVSSGRTRPDTLRTG